VRNLGAQPRQGGRFQGLEIHGRIPLALGEAHALGASARGDKTRGGSGLLGKLTKTRLSEVAGMRRSKRKKRTKEGYPLERKKVNPEKKRPPPSGSTGSPVQGCEKDHIRGGGR